MDSEQNGKRLNQIRPHNVNSEPDECKKVNAPDNSAPKFVKPNHVIGNQLIFRNASASDAEFILELRTDARKSQYISKTPPDLDSQKAWLERYAADDTQLYFVIWSKNSERIGTVRMYDQRGSSFCWGSWIMKSGSPKVWAIESALIVYQLGLRLGFEQAHFDVRIRNESVWRFHEKFGAQRTGFTSEDYFYNISREKILASIKRYERFLPDGIIIT